jgi:hypothetical protein
MPVSLGTISFDDDAVAKQLRGDMKDDWFSDPLLFKDMLNSGLLSKIIDKNYSKNNGQYLTFKRDLFNIPKANFTLRYALETGLADRFLYHALSAALVPHFDPLLSPSVYSHRYDHVAAKHKYLFKKGVGAWNDFIGSVSSALGPDSFLLSTDLTNYFEGIELGRLKAQLIDLLPELKATTEEKARARLLIDLLFGSLKEWTFDEKRGLPQNRDASSFLANIYMVPIDREMEKHGFSGRYFRYMDDIKIICDDKSEARLALKKLILILREQRLAVNAKKTIIASSKDTNKIAECLQQVLPAVTYIDSIWKTNSPAKILAVLPSLRQLALSLMDVGDYESKAFRFCINRLYTVCMCPTLSIPNTYFEAITPKIIQGLDVMPAATDQLAKYLRAAPTTDSQLDDLGQFLMDSKRAIYNWQNFHIWNVLTDKKFSSTTLIDFASDVVSNQKDCPGRAGATLYLGAMGDGAKRELIAKKFQTLTTFFGQRVALISLHEVPYAPLIKEFVKPFLRTDLVGAYLEMHKKPGIYCQPLEPVLLGEETYEEVES